MFPASELLLQCSCSNSNACGIKLNVNCFDVLKITHANSVSGCIF